MPSGIEEAELLKAIVADGKQALAGKLKSGLGKGFTNTGIVLTVLRQPLLVVTDNVTL